jgi:hypothetical protein
LSRTHLHQKQHGRMLFYAQGEESPSLSSCGASREPQQQYNLQHCQAELVGRSHKSSPHAPGRWPGSRNDSQKEEAMSQPLSIHVGPHVEPRRKRQNAWGNEAREIFHRVSACKPWSQIKAHLSGTWCKDGHFKVSSRQMDIG